MDKRYQVFVSSTYLDLKEERQSVTQTLMEMDCIPAGMELFPAADEDQWSFIEKVIDDCDYYLLIIGGRYGSLSDEGVSYTEKEYDYAVAKGLKIVALIHGNPGELPFEKSEGSAELRGRLEAFRAKASSGRLVKFWKHSSELPGLVALNITKTIRLYPALGWVRASGTSSEGLLLELNELRKMNSSLEAQILSLKSQEKPVYSIPDLADLDEEFRLYGTYQIGYGSDGRWELYITWREIFYLISPYLVGGGTGELAKHVLKEAVCLMVGRDPDFSSLSDQVFQTIVVQLQALGLITINVSESGMSGATWNLTTSGEKKMVELRAVRKI